MSTNGLWAAKSSARRETPQNSTVLRRRDEAERATGSPGTYKSAKRRGVGGTGTQKGFRHKGGGGKKVRCRVGSVILII